MRARRGAAARRGAQRSAAARSKGPCHKGAFAHSLTRRAPPLPCRNAARRLQVTFKTYGEPVNALVNTTSVAGWADIDVPELFPCAGASGERPGLLVRWCVPTFEEGTSESPQRAVVRALGNVMLAGHSGIVVTHLSSAVHDLMVDSSALLAPPEPPAALARRSPRLLEMSKRKAPWYAAFQSAGAA